jgi:exodeoxyribonuclease V alpha subunit
MDARPTRELTLPAEEITAEFRTEIWSSDGDPRFIIGSAQVQIEDGEPAAGLDFSKAGYFTIKGNAEELALRPNIEYRFFGKWENNAKHGRQFSFQTFVQAQPRGRRGTIRYLCLLPGIGNFTALRLWEAWGSECVDVLRETPEVAAETIQRLSLKKATAAAKKLMEAEILESATIDLLNLFEGRTLGKNIVKSVLADYGNKGAEMIRKNPYLLMRYRGVGFLTTDAMYLELGMNPNKLKRQTMCISHAISSNQDGHIWHSKNWVKTALDFSISSTETRLDEALSLGRRAGLLSIRKDEAGETWVANRKDCLAEEWISQKVSEIQAYDRPGIWPVLSADDGLTPHQVEIGSAVMAGRIGILGGAPGVGKTYTTAAIVRRLLDAGIRVAVCGPTGKSAVRITESMSEAGLNIEATTIHRLLGCVIGDQGGHDGTGWKFTFGAGNPFTYNVIVVDEVSMVDNEIMSSLMKACKESTQLLLVGDINQLPPVGRGTPLRDLISAGIPYGELTEIHRNSGRIVQACHEIKETGKFSVSGKMDLDSKENLVVVPASVNHQISAIETLIRKMDATGRYDVKNDLQVLCVVNEKSPVSRVELNRRLQPLLNPDGEGCENNPFRNGDKVISTKNNWYSPVPTARKPGERRKADVRVFVANGEMGEVVAIEENKTVIRLTSPGRVITVPRGTTSKENNTGCDWQLGYAVTIHKFQGSESPVVAIVVDESAGAKWISCRESVYTAISRAKELCVLFGSQSTAEEFCKRQILPNRKTFLVERLKEMRLT